ncbi:MAG: protein kinase [Chloroflexota bacterium]
MTLYIDQTLDHGRYLIQKRLGQGGMGTVYLALDQQNSARQVAIKENQESALEFQIQFRNEAQTLARLDHPNLPRIDRYFMGTNNCQYLVMDYIDGETLKDIQTNRTEPLSEDEIRPWLSQIMDALEYMHTWIEPKTRRLSPIIHRDIKPENIKRSSGGQIFLVDFGISKLESSGRTHTAARAYSIGFSPIEQYTGGTDARSDIYALGATLYSLVTRSVPANATEIASGKALVSPREVNPDISRQLERVILKSMSLKPSERYNSVAEMRAALGTRGAIPFSKSRTKTLDEPLEIERKTTTSQPILPRVPTEPRGSWWPTVLIILLLLIIGASLYLALAPNRTSEEGSRLEVTPITQATATSPPETPAGRDGSLALIETSPTSTSTRKPTVTPITMMSTPNENAPSVAEEDRGEESAEGIFDASPQTIANELVDIPTDTPTGTPEPTQLPTDTLAPTEEPTNTPTDTPEPTQLPTDTLIPTDTPEPTEEPTNTPTDTPIPTDTLAPTEEPTNTPTDTPEPTQLPTDTPNPTPTKLVLTPTQTPISEPETAPTVVSGSGQLATPTPSPVIISGRLTTRLVAPLETTLRGEYTFIWQTDYVLTENQFFEVVVWEEGLTAMGNGLGLVSPTKDNEVRVNLNKAIQGIPQLNAGKRYYWGILIVEIEPDYTRILHLEASHPFQLEWSGGGGSAPTPTPTPRG